MPRLTPLPERLRYLQPFRRQTAKLKPEEIDESMDLSLLNEFLCQRMDGVSPEAGKRMLQEDQEVLAKWLESPDLEDNGGMVFLHGYLMALPELVDRLLEARGKPGEEQIEVQMDLPPEAKIKKQRGGLWKVTWLRTTLFALPSTKEYTEFQIKDFQEGPREKLAKVTVTSVKFGNITGFKRLVDLSIVGAMHVDYALIVPGGYASVTLLKKATNIDPSQFENYFHTIRIVPR